MMLQVCACTWLRAELISHPKALRCPVLLLMCSLELLQCGCRQADCALDRTLTHPISAYSSSSRLQGWFGDLQLPISVQQQGSLALTALAAICAHLKRMRAEQELAGGSQLVMPYEVYAGQT